MLDSLIDYIRNFFFIPIWVLVAGRETLYGDILEKTLAKFNSCGQQATCKVLHMKTHYEKCSKQFTSRDATPTSVPATAKEYVMIVIMMSIHSHQPRKQQSNPTSVDTSSKPTPPQRPALTKLS